MFCKKRKAFRKKQQITKAKNSFFPRNLKKAIMKKIIVFAFVLASLFACKPQEGKEKNEQKDTTQTVAKEEKAAIKEDKKEEVKTETPSPNINLSGAYYCPETKEMFLLQWNGKKIAKLKYAAAGSNDFVDSQVIEESSPAGVLEFSFSFRAGTKTMKSMMGLSPGGIVFSITDNNNDASQREFWEISSEGGFSMEAAEYGVPFFVREIYWRGFKNESNGATLIAEDSQEGTGEGQLNMGYKDASGKEEFFAAQVNPKTRELTFNSQVLGGKIRCQLDKDNEMRWVLRVFRGNQKIGDFTQIIGEQK